MDITLISPREHEFFRGLSESIRLRMAVLLVFGELCVCDLTAILGLPQSTVSRHMGKLKWAGVAVDQRKGKWVYYRLADTGSSPLSQLEPYLRLLADREPYKTDAAKLRQRRPGSCDDTERK